MSERTMALFLLIKFKNGETRKGTFPQTRTHSIRKHTLMHSSWGL